jgi:hypothetical protein
MQQRRRWIALVGAILVWCSAGPRSLAAETVTITFESVAGVTPTSSYFGGTFVADGSRLSTQMQLSEGVSFSSPAGYVALVHLGLGHATSGANGIGGVTAPSTLHYQSPVVITFTVPGDPSLAAITDFVSIRGDQWPHTGVATMEAFDVGGALLASVSANDVSGGLVLSISNPNIHSIRLTQTSSDIAYDDLTFNTPEPAVTPQQPTANAGADQSIHAGQLVTLDGSGSFDDNTATEDLSFAWSLTSKPAGSSAALTGADTVSPSFMADVIGDYVVSLVVTDADALSSEPDAVVLSSLNSAPTADAGLDSGTSVGNPITLDGSASHDPDGDALGFSWTLAAPVGSAAAMAGATTATPAFTPDVPGLYTATLTVTDPFGAVSTDSVAISVITAEHDAERLILGALTVCPTLTPAQVTTKGNCIAFQNFLTQAIAAIQRNDLDQARMKLREAIERTDGCSLNGAPDGNGPGRDWIIDCTAQQTIYAALTAALSAILPSAAEVDDARIWSRWSGIGRSSAS